MTTPANSGQRQRAYWVEVMERIATPVFFQLAQERLKVEMPVEIGPGGGEDRRDCSPLEAFGRSLAGVAPWLALPGLSGEEETKRAAMAGLAKTALAHATDPGSVDFLNFSRGQQPLVDAAFLAEGLLRSRRVVWDTLDAPVQRNVIACLQATRTMVAPS